MEHIPLLVNHPGEFGYIEGQTYYNELLAHYVIEHASRMASAGYEITFEAPDTYDYAILWLKQSSTISALIDTLNAQKVDGEMKDFFIALANELFELLPIPNSRENYTLRAATITAAENALNLTEIKSTLPEEPEEPEEPEDTALALLWNAQTDVIHEQSERLTIIFYSLEQKRNNLDNYTQDWGEVLIDGLADTLYDKLIDWLKSFVEEIPVVGHLIDFISNLAKYSIKYLKELYRKAVSYIGALQRENDAMLNIPMVWENYYLRLSILQQHEEVFDNLLREIEDNEQKVRAIAGEGSKKVLEVLEKIENTLSGRAEKDEDSDLQEFWEEVGDKLEEILPQPDIQGNLPAIPEHPVRLPKLPDDNENRRNSMLMKLLYNLMCLEAAKIQELQKISEGLDGLQYQSVEVEMGDRRLNFHGKIVDLNDVV